MSAGSVWLNGRLVVAAEATLSVGDRGFLLGDGLFETMRAYGGRVFRLEAHLTRLARGAERIGLPLPDALDEAVLATLHANDLGDAAIRLTVSRGPAGPGLDPPPALSPTVVVTVRPCSVHPGLYESGLHAVTAAARLDERRLTAGLKHTGYLEAILAVRQARLAGADEAIFLDTAGHVAEASAGNVLAVQGDELWTPPVACGILPGITRATVLELAPRLGFRVREEPLPPEALAGADEAFLTSSLREIVPLVALDGVPIGGTGATARDGAGASAGAQAGTGAQAQGQPRKGAAVSGPAHDERSAAGRPGPGTLRLLQAYRDLARAEAEGVA